MFERFINLRRVFKGRLPIKMFRSNFRRRTAEVQQTLDSGLDDGIDVRLRKPNKRFIIKNEDRVVRIKDYLQYIYIYIFLNIYIYIYIYIYFFFFSYINYIITQQIHEQNKN